MRNKGEESPLDIEPELYEDLADVWQAFHTLSNDRPIGMGAVGGITFTAIHHYAERFEIEDFDEFCALIRAMDAEYLKHVNKSK